MTTKCGNPQFIKTSNKARFIILSMLSLMSYMSSTGVTYYMVHTVWVLDKQEQIYENINSYMTHDPSRLKESVKKFLHFSNYFFIHFSNKVYSSWD